MSQEGTDTYLSVGQLARKMGVTVRTIQYYDQKGLLTPSAKGPGNQRLYSSADEEALCRILVLKYLGLSLADIRAHQEALNDSDAFRIQIGRTLADLEEDFEALVRRLSIVRKMLADSEDCATTDWTHMAQLIEGDQPDGQSIWRAAEMVDVVPAEPKDSEKRGLAVGEWHELIADAIGLISERVPATDERARDLARRYLELEGAQTGSLEDSFLLMENISPHSGGNGSFDVLRQSVSAYLDEASAALKGESDR
ncbi:MAG: MerR family transcriptional regulator [Coriobacteriales bacterium]|jgi:DNA-binding transcriptional MerR regulator